MAVHYSVFKQKFDVSRKDKLMYYAKVQSSGVLDFSRLCKKVSDRCTATKGDVMVVLDGCGHVMTEAMSEGQIVRLGDFGSFQLTASSKGSLTENDFNSSNITKVRIQFYPGEELKAMLKELTFKKVRNRSTRSALLKKQTTKEK